MFLVWKSKFLKQCHPSVHPWMLPPMPFEANHDPISKSLKLPLVLPNPKCPTLTYSRQSLVKILCLSWPKSDRQLLLKISPSDFNFLLAIHLLHPLPPLVRFPFQMKGCQRDFTIFKCLLVIKILHNTVKPNRWIITRVLWKIQLRGSWLIVCCSSESNWLV